MASNTNLVSIIGRLTRDPEARALASGSNLAEIGIAVNSASKQSDGSYEDEAHFFNCTAWNNTADTIMRFCHKGDRVSILGRLQQQRWDDASGGKRERVSIVINSIEFLTTKAESAARGTQATAPPLNPGTPADEEVPF